MTRLRPSGLRLGVHMATGLCALALGVLPPPWHLVAAASGLLVGWVVFPLTGLEARLRRPGEGWWGGLRTYPLAVAGLVAFLPRPQAAAAWGILAVGDGLAGFVGSRVPSPALLGHPKATWSGSAAHWVGGGLAALGLSAAVVALDHSLGGPGVGSAPGLTACAAAALAGALTDLLPIPPDDNLPVAAAAGLTLAAWV